MTDNFLEDHMRGEHQAEIVAIMAQLEPALDGHRRAICCFALTRMLAVMLGPASKATRDGFIAELPGALHDILAKMDDLMRTRS